MEKLNASNLIKDAKEKLAGKNVRPMAVIHTGVTVAAALVITVLQYVLAKGIGNTGGLSGMGTRSILETLQTVLQWANMVLLPFWNLGFLYVALRWTRGDSARKEDLLAGFHRVGPCLGLFLNRTVLMILVMIFGINLSSAFFMMTPAAEQLTALVGEASSVEEVYAFMEQMSQQEAMSLFYSMVPALVAWLLLCAVILVPLMFRFRLAEYVILDQEGARALPAMLISAALLRRRCWQFFKIDLRLWWYYGLKALCLLLCYGDLLLRLLGVPLPMGDNGAYILFYLLYLAALFCVEVGFRPHVETVYAGAYETLAAMGPAQRQTVPTKPQHLPWDEQE